MDLRGGESEYPRLGDAGAVGGQGVRDCGAVGEEERGAVVLKSVASRQAFLSEKGHRFRFVYTPKHSSVANEIETVFGVIMRKVIRRGSFSSVDDLQSKLWNFIAYFNRVFAKPFHWTYTGRPLRVKVA